MISKVFPNFKGIMLISGLGKNGGNGHAMFVEIDAQNQMYIVYDNNVGFYQWNNKDSFLIGLQNKFKDDRYEKCEGLAYEL